MHKYPKTILFALAVTAGALVSPGLHAATILASEDAYINLASPNANFGSEITLRAYSDSFGQDKSYIKFDASSYGARQVTAVSSIDLTSAGSAFTRNISVYLIKGTGADSWTEGAITWNNAPSNDDTGKGFIADAGQTVILLGNVSASGTDLDPISLTLTPGSLEELALLNELNTGDRVVTLGIQSASSDRGTLVSSRDRDGGLYSPALQVTAEPSTGGGSLANKTFASEDAYINLASPNANFGSEITLRAYSDSFGQDKSYIKFDASSYGARQVTAVSSIDLTSAGSGFTRNISVYLIKGTGADSWTEGAITWNNAPSNDDTGKGFIADAGQTITLLGSTTASGTDLDPVTLTLTPDSAEELLLRNELNTGDRVVTLGIQSASSDRGTLVSSWERGLYAPMLSTTLEPLATTTGGGLGYITVTPSGGTVTLSFDVETTTDLSSGFTRVTDVTVTESPQGTTQIEFNSAEPQLFLRLAQP